MFNLLHNLKSKRDARKLQKSIRKNSSDYTSISTLDTLSRSSSSALSFESENAPSIDELEFILENTNKHRYSEQDVQLSMAQELDLDLAKLTSLLERGEKRRLASQDFSPVL
ncbi:hypothetical protein K7432_000862 [Basidiobolus ranarum]|uniref:Uncharacterized protein n=1 Tax=Basidiobolus ranarum TaxID=34480 RepID=A0ABR2WAL9_9FUNG